MIERALTISGFALVEVISNCHVLYGKMNEMAEASKMIAAMDEDTQRTNPTLLRRGTLPLRLTTPSAPFWEEEPLPTEGVTEEQRTWRGVIIENKGSIDFSERYYTMLDEIKVKREESEISYG
jgi:pyruvate/2-oxoacid:ferredoxin oxidoreductase beta subunit